MRGRRVLITALAVLALGACTTSASTGAPCVLNSDCPGTLVCSGGYCHVMCAADRDCRGGETCDRDAGVCVAVDGGP